MDKMMMDQNGSSRRKPRGQKQGLVLVVAKASMRVHAQLHPPLQNGALHTVEIKQDSCGIVCGPDPSDEHFVLVAFEHGENLTATASVSRDLVFRA